MIRKLQLTTLMMLVAAAGTFTATEAAGRFHFDLSGSEPEADATVPAPDTVTLWFTEVPQENSVSIRLVDAEGELVDASDASQDPEDGRKFSVTPGATLVPGRYTVAWRGIGSDGHTVRGDFGFSVAPSR
ncbi:MAG TPA: copper resistance protein CopC [Kofleriaceae bacterium]|nr:copper resistance protein CopC [Kofleriaceae bacterium]